MLEIKVSIPKWRQEVADILLPNARTVDDARKVVKWVAAGVESEVSCGVKKQG